MENIALKQVYFGGVTVQVPEIWEVETEEMVEADGQKSYSIAIEAAGNDVRSIDISYGAMPEGSDAYAEACGTYEEIVKKTASRPMRNLSCASLSRNIRHTDSV